MTSPAERRHSPGNRSLGYRPPIGYRSTSEVTAVTAVTAPGESRAMTTVRPELAAILAQLAELLAQPEPPPVPAPEKRPPQRVLLTVEEAAEQLGIGRTMVYRLIRDNEIESVQIGRLRRIPMTSVRDYAARLIAGRAA